MKKRISILVLLLSGLNFVFSQSFVDEFLGRSCCAYVENDIFQYKDSSQTDYTKVKQLCWNEFSDAQESSGTRQAIPNKIFIVTAFIVTPDNAGEELLSKPAFFKTTMQFIYGLDISGYNINRPILGEEITMIEGSFTSKDILEMFNTYQGLELTGLRFRSKDFLLTNYLEENNVNLFYSEKGDKWLGRIVLRTYFGDSKDNLEMTVESIINPMDFYVYE